MFRSVQGSAAKSRIVAAAAVAVAAVGLTACAASGGTPAAAPATTVTQTAQASPPPAASSHTAAPGPAPAASSPTAAPGPAPAASSPTATPSAPAGGPAGSSSAGKLPDYQPSTVVSESEYSTVLTSPDSVSKVGQFYRNALATSGWHVTSSSMSAYHASFTADRSHQGVSISVYSTGSGSGVSISTHPR
jgi:hypothetical protein